MICMELLWNASILNPYQLHGCVILFPPPQHHTHFPYSAPTKHLPEEAQPGNATNPSHACLQYLIIQVLQWASPPSCLKQDIPMLLLFWRVRFLVDGAKPETLCTHNLSLTPSLSLSLSQIKQPLKGAQRRQLGLQEWKQDKKVSPPPATTALHRLGIPGSMGRSSF